LLAQTARAMLTGQLEVLMGVRTIRVDDRSGKEIDHPRGDCGGRDEHDLRVIAPWCPALSSMSFEDLGTPERLAVIGYLASIFKVDRAALLDGAVGYDGSPLVEEGAAPAISPEPSAVRRRPRAASALVEPPPAAPSGVSTPPTLAHVVVNPEADAPTSAPAADLDLDVDLVQPAEPSGVASSSELPATLSPVEPTVASPVELIDGEPVKFVSADGIAQTDSGWFWRDDDGVWVGPFGSCPMARMNCQDVRNQQG
jgi:hypothetical protein